MSASALKKAVYRAKKKLPKSPKRFAEIVSRLVQNVTPRAREKEALRMKGISEPKTKKNLDNLVDVLKDVDSDVMALSHYSVSY